MPRRRGLVNITLDKDNFCCVMEDMRRNVASSYGIVVPDTVYCFFYRDGVYNKNLSEGGTIYPFAPNPAKRGNWLQQLRFNSAKAVCISKDCILKIYWGTKDPFTIFDKSKNKAYRVGASGVFFAHVNPTSSADANKLYKKVLAHRDANAFNTEAMRDFLSDAFKNHIGVKIQEYIKNSDRPLENYVGIGLEPSEFVEISKAIYPEVQDIFNDCGVTIVEKLSSGSILQELRVTEIE